MTRRLRGQRGCAAAAACVVIAALALGSAPAHAQPTLDASAELRTDAWSGNRLLDDRGALAAASLWASARVDLGDAGRLAGSGWLRTTTQDDGAPGGRVRELYWSRDIGPVSLRVGRQMIAWGRADGLNPTDNLAPRDYTLLVPADGDQRHGTTAVSAKWSAGPGVLSAAWFPRAASHTLALPAVPGLRYAVQAPPRRAQWALKWDAAVDGIDGSVSYFDGRDPWPDLAIVAAGPAGVDVALRNQRARVLGADLSLERDGVVWRAEAAWLRTASTGRGDFLHKRPQLWIVAGPEWSLRDALTVGLQGTYRQVSGWTAPDTLADPVARAVAVRQAAIAGQTARRQAGLLWRVASKPGGERLALETSGVVTGPSRNGVWRAQADVAWSDTVHVQAGVSSAFGSDETTFGQLRRNRLAYLQVRVGL